MSVTVVPPTDGTKEVVDNVVELGKTLPSSSYKNRLFCIYLSVSPMPFFVYHSLTLGISSLHCTSLWHPHLSLSPQQFSVVASGKPFSRTGGGSNGGEHSLSVRVYPNGVCVCTKLYCLLLPKRFLAVLSLSLSLPCPPSPSLFEYRQMFIPYLPHQANRTIPVLLFGERASFVLTSRTAGYLAVFDFFNILFSSPRFSPPQKKLNPIFHSNILLM